MANKKNLFSIYINFLTPKYGLTSGTTFFKAVSVVFLNIEEVKGEHVVVLVDTSLII